MPVWGTERMDLADSDEGRTLRTVEDMRAAPRFSLMLRTAKLIARDGEYVCIVRDVSQTGTKLRLFHAPPPDEFLLLELGNGSIYPVQSVWRHEGHAGFRFAAPVNVAEFMEEPCDYPRRQIRLRLSRPARLTADGQAISISLLNLSQQGMGFESAIDLPVGQRVKVEVQGLPARIGNVCWRRKQRHGVACQQAFTLEELARFMLAMQPYSTVAKADISTPSGSISAPVANCA